MFDWFIETGFGYLLGIAAVTLIGLLLICWGVWGDRSKGRSATSQWVRLGLEWRQKDVADLRAYVAANYGERSASEA